MNRALRLTTTCLLAVTTSAAAAIDTPPTKASTVCDRYQKSDIIFTGSAETTWVDLLETRKSPVPLHAKSDKSRRVGFLVREWFKGKRADIVDVWIMPGACDEKIEANQTYLVYAHVGKDKKGKDRIESDGCAGTILAGNAASDLSYLTVARQGPNRATRVSGTAVGPGSSIQARAGVELRYAATDKEGRFIFDGLPAGDWGLSIVGGTDVSPVHVEPSSCVDVSLK